MVAYAQALLASPASMPARPHLNIEVANRRCHRQRTLRRNSSSPVFSSGRRFSQHLIKGFFFFFLRQPQPVQQTETSSSPCFIGQCRQRFEGRTLFTTQRLCVRVRSDIRLFQLAALPHFFQTSLSRRRSQDAPWERGRSVVWTVIYPDSFQTWSVLLFGQNAVIERDYTITLCRR